MPPKKGSGKPEKTRPQPLDDLDNFFLEGDLDEDDPFASPKGGKTDPNPKRKKPDDGLGLDEEVSVSKKPRAPRVKLDAERLLSEKGLAELRRLAKDLELKGKGHEWSDASRLLSLYQGWLDGLFPRGKFLDALAMVEKAGHNKVVRKVRGELINEDKPKTNVADTDENVDAAGNEQVNPHFVTRPAEGQGPEKPTHRQLFPSHTIGRSPWRHPENLLRGDPPEPTAPPQNASDDVATPTVNARAVGPGMMQPRYSTWDGDDIYGATPPPDKRTTTAVETGGGPDDDELDALMAASEPSGPMIPMRPSVEQATSAGSSGNPISVPVQPENNYNDAAAAGDDDDDDLDALIAEAEAEQASRQNASTAAVDNTRKLATAEETAEDDVDHLDDLDALLADAEAQNAPSKFARPGP